MEPWEKRPIIIIFTLQTGNGDLRIQSYTAEKAMVTKSPLTFPISPFALGAEESSLAIQEGDDELRVEASGTSNLMGSDGKSGTIWQRPRPPVGCNQWSGLFHFESTPQI